LLSANAMAANTVLAQRGNGHSAAAFHNIISIVILQKKKVFQIQLGH